MGRAKTGTGEAAALQLLAGARRGRSRPGRLDQLTNWYMGAATGVVLAGLLAGLLRAEPSAALMQFATTRGALAVGVIAAIGVAAGLRTGALGGPLVLRRPDVLLVLLSPVRHDAFLKERLRRTAVISISLGAGVGAFVLAAVAARLGVHPLWLLCAGAVSGAAIAALSLGTAMLSNAADLDPSTAMLLAAAVIGIGALNLAVAWMWSPLAWIGAVALWPIEHDTAGGLLGLLMCSAVLAAGFRVMKRVDLEAAQQRTSTMVTAAAGAALQDVRALLVAAHSRPDEQFRTRPWFAAPPPSEWAAWRRSWHGLLRTPLTRVLRVLGCGGVIGVSVGLSATSPVFVVFGVTASYLAALEVIEPVAQVIDRPAARVAYPAAASRLYRRMLPASIIVMATAFLVGGFAAYAVGGLRPAVALLVAAVPASFAATSAAVYALVRGEPDAHAYFRFAADSTGIVFYQYHLRPAAAAGSGVIAAAATVAGASMAVPLLAPAAVGVIMVLWAAWAARGQL